MSKAWEMRAFAACAGLSLFLALLLGGCGGTDTTAVDAREVNASEDAVTTEILDEQMATRATGAMTMIDAATGDASAMPDDSNEAVSVETIGPANDSIASASPPPAPALRREEGDLLPSVAE